VAVSTWTTKYDKDLTNLSSFVRGAKAFLSSQRANLGRYRGGMPSSVLACIAQKESSGRMVAGDESLVEWGYFQITSTFPSSVGVNPEVRKTEPGNIFLAGLEYNVEAARLQVRYPSLIVAGSTDQWMMSRATFALGIGAVKNLINLVGPSRRGQMFTDILAYADANQGVSVSGYDPGKVWYRLKSIPLIWRAAAQIGGTTCSEPVQVPRLVPYKVPKDVASVLLPPSALAGFGSSWIAAGAGVGLFFLLRKMR
jgi:hypothetical protein